MPAKREKNYNQLQVREDKGMQACTSLLAWPAHPVHPKNQRVLCRHISSPRM